MKTEIDAINKHGLKRSELNAEVARAVRQRCGFGCVICGSAIVQYHHFDPPFTEATAHRAEGITLLCGGCHDKVTRKVWSDEKVRRANEQPKAKQSNARELLDLAAPISLVLGSMIFRGDGPLITIGSECLLKLRFTEDGALLGAQFFDEEGQPTVTVVDNELRFCADAWDIEAIGTRLVVRRGPRKIVFEAVLHPPYGIYVRSLNLAMHGWTLATDSKGRIQVSHASGKRLAFDQDAVTIHGGSLHLQDNGGLVQRDGFVQAPFPANRLKRLARSGQFDRLLWEITLQPTIHVNAVRDPKKPIPDDALHGISLGNGSVRYAIYCEVCNDDRAGTRELPEGQPVPPRSGLMCAQCAKLPPDAWAVMHRNGTEIARFSTRGEAIAQGHTVLKQNPTWRLVIHDLNNEPPRIFFADES